MTASANTAKLSLITRDTARVIGIEGYPTAISDGFALDLNSPIPLTKYRQQKRWRELPATVLFRLLKLVEGTTVLLLLPTHCLRAGIFCYRYPNGLSVNQKYIDYFQARYPGCRLWASPGDGLEVIAVKHNDEIVGLIMPMARETAI